MTTRSIFYAVVVGVALGLAVCLSQATRPEPTIQFSGYRWNIKISERPIDPGPNRWSGEPEDIFVDRGGRLHLSIRQHGGLWYCSEIVLDRSMGHGIYTVRFASSLRARDIYAVFSPFLYESPFREIDFEAAGAGLIPRPHDAQFAVQPAAREGHLHRFSLTSSSPATLRVSWKARSVEFLLWRGHEAYPPARDLVLASWSYAGDRLPIPGNERFRFNLWLVGGHAPVSGQPEEMVVESFEYHAHER